MFSANPKNHIPNFKHSWFAFEDLLTDLYANPRK